MLINVLGPLTVHCAGCSATPTAPKPRSVLAVLLVHANQTVPSADLAQELWGDTPPASALTTLQTYILHLRKMFANATGMSTTEVAETVLLTVPSGYLFQSVSDDFDLPMYELLAAGGRRALAAGDDAAAADLLVRAGRLWRGAPLAGMRTGRVLEPEVRRLAEDRLATTEQSIEAHLRLGRHREMLPQLSALRAAHRLHENLHAQSMIALHRSGRRQEALEVFLTLRTAMREELGLEPSRQIRLLQRAILVDDPELHVPPRNDGLVQLLDRLPTR
jgi:DNA-binding SARP family transcriptional activator